MVKFVKTTNQMIDSQRAENKKTEGRMWIKGLMVGGKKEKKEGMLAAICRLGGG